MSNSIMVTVKYMQPTNTHGACIKLSTYDGGSFDDRKKEKIKRLNYNYSMNGAADQAKKALETAGLTVIAFNGNNPEYDVFMCEWNHEAVTKLFSKQ